MATVFRDKRMKNAAGKPAWMLNYKGVDGRRIRERTQAVSKEEAVALLRRRIRDHVEAQARGLQSVEALKPITFQSFYTEKYLPILRQRLRPSSFRRKENLAAHVLPIFGPKPLRSINAGDVAQFIAKRAKATPRPSNRELNMEKGFLS